VHRTIAVPPDVVNRRSVGRDAAESVAGGVVDGGSSGDDAAVEGTPAAAPADGVAGAAETARETASGVSGCPVFVLTPLPISDSASRPTPAAATAPTVHAATLARTRRRVTMAQTLAHQWLTTY
jgi:hypothetical protein